MKFAFAAVAFCIIVITSCNKTGRTKDECLPPPHDNISKFNFVVKNSVGENLLTTRSPSKLEIKKLGVYQLCDSGNASVVDLDTAFSISHVVWPRQNTGICSTIFLKWTDTDTDTLSYTYDVSYGCGIIYNINSIFFNDKLIVKDSISRSGKEVFTLYK